MTKRINPQFSMTYLPKYDIKETIALAKMAEKCGLHRFWVYDEVPSYPFRDPIVTMARIANKTRKMGVGLVSNPYSRHPSLVAAALLTVDEAARGRSAFCYVAGGSLVLPYLGYKMWERPVRRMRESTLLLRRLLKGENVEYVGETVKLLGSKMFNSGNIPIYLGVRGPQMLRLAGEIADGVDILTPPGYFEYALERVAEGAEKAGRSIRDLDIGGAGTFYVSRDEAEARESAKYPLTWSIPDCPNILREKVGISHSDARKIAEIRRKDGVDAAVKLITDDMVDAMSISGNPDQCARRVVENFRKGVTQYMFGPPLGKTERIGLKLIGEEVIPKVNAMMH